MFLFYAHSSAIAKTWAILIGNSPRKRRIWRPPTKSLWWIWIKTSLQDSPFSIQSLCSMSEKPIPIAPPSSSYKPILPKHLAKMIFKKSLSRLTFLYYQFSAAIQSEVIAAASTYSTYFPFRKHSMLINVFSSSPSSFGCCLQYPSISEASLSDKYTTTYEKKQLFMILLLLHSLLFVPFVLCH